MGRKQGTSAVPNDYNLTLTNASGIFALTLLDVSNLSGYCTNRYQNKNEIYLSPWFRNEQSCMHLGMTLPMLH
jgi:hypothetical protein